MYEVLYITEPSYRKAMVYMERLIRNADRNGLHQFLNDYSKADGDFPVSDREYAAFYYALVALTHSDLKDLM